MAVKAITILGFRNEPWLLFFWLLGGLGNEGLVLLLSGCCLFLIDVNSWEFAEVLSSMDLHGEEGKKEEDRHREEFW